MKKIGIILLLLSSFLFSKAGTVINTESDIALTQLKKKYPSAYDLLMNKAKAYLIFPSVVKGGFGVGGEYGEGVLRASNGVIIGYYSTASASIGFQFGVQKKSIVIAFLTDKALENFIKSDGWKVGVDGSIALVNIGASGAIDSATLNKPMVAFIFGEKGLMYNLTLEGSKFSKITR